MLWTECVLEGGLTIQEFVGTVKTKENVQVDSLNVNGTWIHAGWNIDPPALGRKITDFLVSEFKEPILAPEQFFIARNFDCVDESDEEV
jgi:hypothetical protein